MIDGKSKAFLQLTPNDDCANNYSGVTGRYSKEEKGCLNKNCISNFDELCKAYTNVEKDFLNCQKKCYETHYDVYAYHSPNSPCGKLADDLPNCMDKCDLDYKTNFEAAKAIVPSVKYCNVDNKEQDVKYELERIGWNMAFSESPVSFNDATIEVELTTENCPSGGCKMPEIEISEYSEKSCKLFIDNIDKLVIKSKDEIEICKENKFWLENCVFLTDTYEEHIELVRGEPLDDNNNPMNKCNNQVNPQKELSIVNYGAFKLAYALKKKYDEDYPKYDDEKIYKQYYDEDNYSKFIADQLGNVIEPKKIELPKLEGVINPYDLYKLRSESNYALCLNREYAVSSKQTIKNLELILLKEPCQSIITPLVIKYALSVNPKLKLKPSVNLSELAVKLKEKIEGSINIEDEYEFNIKKEQNFEVEFKSLIYEAAKKLCPALGASLNNKIKRLKNNIWNSGDIKYNELADLTMMFKSPMAEYGSEMIAASPNPDNYSQYVAATSEFGKKFTILRQQEFNLVSKPEVVTSSSAIDNLPVIYFADVEKRNKIIDEIQGLAQSTYDIDNDTEVKDKIFEILKKMIKLESGFLFDLKEKDGKLSIVRFDSKLYKSTQNNLFVYLSKIWNVPVKQKEVLREAIEDKFKKKEFDSATHLEFIEELSLTLFDLAPIYAKDIIKDYNPCSNAYQCLYIQKWIEMILSYSDSCTPSDDDRFNFKEPASEYRCEECEYDFRFRRFKNNADNPNAICGIAGLMAYEYVIVDDPKTEINESNPYLINTDKKQLENKVKYHAWPDLYLLTCLRLDDPNDISGKGLSKVKACLNDLYRFKTETNEKGETIITKEGMSPLKITQPTESVSNRYFTLFSFTAIKQKKQFIFYSILASFVAPLSLLPGIGIPAAIVTGLLTNAAKLSLANALINESKATALPNIYPNKVFSERAAWLEKNQEERIKRLNDAFNSGISYEDIITNKEEKYESLYEDLIVYQRVFMMKNYKLRYSYEKDLVNEKIKKYLKTDDEKEIKDQLEILGKTNIPDMSLTDKISNDGKRIKLTESEVKENKGKTDFFGKSGTKNLLYQPLGPFDIGEIPIWLDHLVKTSVITENAKKEYEILAETMKKQSDNMHAEINEQIEKYGTPRNYSFIEKIF